MQAARHPRTRPLSAALALAVLLGACAPARPPAAPSPTVVFLSDFGTQDDSVALCKGVMYGITPELRIVDLTHQAPVYDVRAAARLIEGTAPYFAKGTVFLAVVDPGVGTSRKPIAVRTRAGHTYVGPDNGLFSRVIEDEGFDEARELANPKYQRGVVSSTFHGRDVFSPAAAYLAAGLPMELLGPALPSLASLPASRPVIEEGSVLGRVDFIEKPYGNVITDIPAELAAQAGLRIGDKLEVRIGSSTFTLPFLHTFGEVAPGQELVLLSSRGRVSFSVNQGDFAARHGVAADQSVVLRRAAP